MHPISQTSAAQDSLVDSSVIIVQS